MLAGDLFGKGISLRNVSAVGVRHFSISESLLRFWGNSNSWPYNLFTMTSKTESDHNNESSRRARHLLFIFSRLC